MKVPALFAIVISCHIICGESAGINNDFSIHGSEPVSQQHGGKTGDNSLIPFQTQDGLIIYETRPKADDKRDHQMAASTFWKRDRPGSDHMSGFWKRGLGTNDAFWKRQDSSIGSDSQFWKRSYLGNLESSDGLETSHFWKRNHLGNPDNGVSHFWKRSKEDPSKESFWKRFQTTSNDEVVPLKESLSDTQFKSSSSLLKRSEVPWNMLMLPAYRERLYRMHNDRDAASQNEYGVSFDMERNRMPPKNRRKGPHNPEFNPTGW